MSASAATQRDPAISNGDLTIVIAEDAETLGEMMLAKLNRAGFRVFLRKDGDAAWAAIRNEAPDLIILDWNLPGIDGISLLSLVRDNPVTEKTPVMMVTAKTEKSEVMTAIQGGADDYIVKPFKTEDLLRRVERLVRRKAKG